MTIVYIAYEKNVLVDQSGCDINPVFASTDNDIFNAEYRELLKEHCLDISDEYFEEHYLDDSMDSLEYWIEIQEELFSYYNYGMVRIETMEVNLT